MSRNFGTDVIAWAAHVGWLAEQLEDIEKINLASVDNPAYQIIKLTAEQALPFYRSFSPEDTGLLKQSHILGESGISSEGGGVTAWSEISIDPNTAENTKYGGYPRDYGPEYHREKRPWFLEAEPFAKALLDQITEHEFQTYIYTISF